MSLGLAVAMSGLTQLEYNWRIHQMKYAAVYCETRYGRCGVVVSAKTELGLEHALDVFKKAPSKANDNEYGLVGYRGFDSMELAVKDAVAWEFEQHKL